jgi:hypothetical protein
MMRSGRALAIAAVSIFASSAWGESEGRVLAGQVAYHYVGRVTLDLSKGTATILAYVTHLEGVPPATPLFNGNPSESTAFFTIRADATFQFLAPNGDVSPVLTNPGPIRMYFTRNPAHNWASADTFSSGQLIATFARQQEQLATIGLIATNTASAGLISSTKFQFGGQNFDIGQLIPRGVTNVTTGSNMPVSTSQTTATFPFAGFGLAF